MLEPLPRAGLGRVALGRHDECAAVRVTQLHRDVGVRYAQVEQVSRAEVPQLVEVHRRRPNAARTGRQ